MRNNRSQPSSSTSNKVTHNFELYKPKIYTTRPNPEEIYSQHENQKKRYDFMDDKRQGLSRYLSRDKEKQKQKEKTYSYRVRKSFNNNNAKSQNGRTVYSIHNVQNQSYERDHQEQYSLLSKSQALMAINLQSTALIHEKKLTEPLSLKSQSQFQSQYLDCPCPKSLNKNLITNTNKTPICLSTQYHHPHPLYIEKDWNMKQSYLTQNNNTSIEIDIKPGTITKQTMGKQEPLLPSLPEHIEGIMYANGINLEKVPEQEQEQGSIVQDSCRKNKSGIQCEKQLINQLNSRTKYYRYRHTQKLKQKHSITPTSQHSTNTNTHINTIFTSKIASKNRIDHTQLQYSDKIENITKLLHHSGMNRLKVSIKLPQFFHAMPDMLLSDEQLRFQAVMIFEDMGITKPGTLYTPQQILIVKHPQSLALICQTPHSGKHCITWYTDGSVYLGQMSCDVREGLGLEWVPGVCVYYGQYSGNMRHGYGAMKYNNMEVYVGVWAYDRYHGYGKVLDGDGWVRERGVFRDGGIVGSAVFGELS